MTEADNKKKTLLENRLYPVFFMFVITFVVTGALISFSHVTAERVKTNKRAFFEKAIMTALNWENVDSMSPAEIHSAFTNNIAPPTPDSGGAYRMMKDGELEAFALPFEGNGFWNTIRGIIGISPDGSELTGLAFYEQSETPGLGAEIVKPYFTVHFRGLKIGESDHPIILEKSGTDKKNGVQAITGATQTCIRLEDMLNEALVAWLERGDS